MTQYSPAWPHGELKEVFPNLFFVMGTNVTIHEGVVLQHSCNMVIVKHGNELTLINTVRLNENGLAALDNLGQVTNVVRIGAFHGRHDAFYLDRYQAKLWALNGVKDIELSSHGKMPFPDCALFIFETSTHPEAILHVSREGGILITCDSIKNWTSIDPFFSEETGKLYASLGFLGEATISKIWQQACNIKAQDFARLKLMSFKHLLSAHGEPLLNDAYEKVNATIKQEFGV
ncbi:hypothetical protein [Candidatus Berkiella aquae]|uniref:Metallo-beta-lactamase domain-containing protein n=1 Tax=Candidatus Berkiella aquae TaxID=295108 RepID=A0A0Q9YM99_9GAMM|nr:hypothetical protein [Candidatus Berkiella aquae]MCS5710426.1 hypothetical protein [Candidatus Berkiella aquae]